MRPILPLLVAALPALPGQAPPRNGLRDLPEPRVSRAVQFSSRDPDGGNSDHGHYVASGDGGRRVLAACRGPGRITRLWSANPTGTLRIELDGRAIWDGPFSALLDGSTAGFRPPLTGRGSGGGFVSLVPLPFLGTCVVSAVPDDPAALYYQVGVELRRETVAADPDRPGLLEADVAALVDPGFPRDAASIRPIADTTVDVDPVELIAIDGAGEIVELRLARADGRAIDERVGRSVWIEVTVDAEVEPSIAAPLGDLLGVAFGGDAIETLPIHGLGSTRVLRFPMPFRERIRIVATPVTRAGTLRLRGDVAWRSLAPDHRRLALRASFRRATNRAGERFELLRLRGAAGHYAGACFAMVGASGQGVTFLEGDQAIAVDGIDPPSIEGTGTEDDFNGAWYFRGGTFGAPWHGLATLDTRRGRVAVARFLGPDPVPFHESLLVTLEHGGRNDAPGSDYSAVAFWYGGPTPPPVEPARRVEWSRPQRAATPIEVRVADARVQLDPEDPDHALLLGREVRLDVSGSAPRVTTLGDAGVGVDAPDGALCRVSPWLPSIRAFRVAGPFRPSAPRTGIDDVFGPERDAAPDATYDDVADSDGQHGWRDLEGPGEWTGYVDLNPLFVPNDGVVVYAACTVTSPHPQDATLVIGSDDAVKVFLDGHVVHRHVGVRGSSRDQDRVPVRLRAGAQLLLIKVEDYDGGFGFHARIDGASGLSFKSR